MIFSSTAWHIGKASDLDATLLLPGSLNSEGVTKRPLVLPGRVRNFSRGGANRGVRSPVLVTSGMATMKV